MTDRRRFLAAMGSFSGALLLPRAVDAVVDVTATPSIFRRHENDLVLVRFSATGTSAPAGRLRVYDNTGRFLGTAGMLPAGGRLYGEFWIPLDGPTRIATDLELPGRAPLRTNHRLEPPPGWTLHWMTIVSASGLAARLESLPPIPRAIELERLRAQDFGLDPVPAALEESAAHSGQLQALLPPVLSAERYLLPLSPVTMFDAGGVPAMLPALMNGSGLRYAVTPGVDPASWLEGPAGNRVLRIGVGTAGNPESLGFSRGVAAMAPLIESHIARRAPLQASTDVLVAGSEPGEPLEAAVQSVRAWNARYAYPRILISDAASFFEGLDTESLPVTVLHPKDVAVPDSAALRAIARERSEGVSGVSRSLMAAGVAAAGDGTTEFADLFALPRRGHLIVNGSPYTRTDVARVPDGGEFIATNVPPMGFAYFSRVPGTGAPTVDSATEGATQSTALVVDNDTGNIASFRDSEGREWVGPGGWNAMARTRLESIERIVTPGLGVRFSMVRWSGVRGRLRTVVSLYEGLPWVDIHNDCEGVGTSALEYSFGFPLPQSQVSWDLGATTAGPMESTGRMRHERFVEIGNDDSSLYFRCHESPYFSVRRDGTLVAYAPGGTCAFRLAPAGRTGFTDDAHVFGWGADPLTVIPASGAQGPVDDTFGSLITTDRRDVTIAGLKEARSGGDWIAFLRDTKGIGGPVRVGGGLLSFDAASQCDLLERNVGEPVSVNDAGAWVAIAPHGLAGVRLSGMRLATT